MTTRATILISLAVSAAAMACQSSPLALPGSVALAPDPVAPVAFPAPAAPLPAAPLPAAPPAFATQAIPPAVFVNKDPQAPIAPLPQAPFAPLPQAPFAPPPGITAPVTPVTPIAAPLIITQPRHRIEPALLPVEGHEGSCH